jgi:hypothetical protein
MVKSDCSYSFQCNEIARPAGLEPAAFCLEGRRSIQLSYGRAATLILNQLFGTTIPFWRAQPTTERANDTILIGMWPGRQRLRILSSSPPTSDAITRPWPFER